MKLPPLPPVLTLMLGLLLGLLPAILSGAPAAVVFDLGHARLTATVYDDGGERGTLIALPGSGADNSRYSDLGPLLAQAGYRVVALNQRGIAGSTGALVNLSLDDYAADVIAVMDSLGLPRAHLMGWALGNRIARAAATLHPDRVSSVILLAAGGLVPPTASVGEELARLLADSSLPLDEKIQLARRTLFAATTPQARVETFARELNYWPEGRAGQTSANRNTPQEEWWAGGSAPLLIIQGAEDVTAPVDNGRQMQTTYPDRVTLVEIAGAGHLMAYEKPEATAAAIIGFLAQFGD